MDQLKLKKWHVLIKRIKVAADAVAATLASGSAGSLGYIFATKMGFVAEKAIALKLGDATSYSLIGLVLAATLYFMTTRMLIAYAGKAYVRMDDAKDIA